MTRKFLLFSVLSFLFLFSSVSAAEKHIDSQKLMWSDSFEIDGTLIGIQSISKSGDENEDDMSIYFHHNGKLKKVPVSPAKYVLNAPYSDLKSLSKKVPVFKIGDSQILLVLFPDNRPGYSQLTLAIYDYKSQKFTGVREKIGDLKEHSFIFLSDGPNRFKTRLIREYLNSLVCSDGPEAAIEDWMLIDHSKDELQCRWK